MPKGQTYKVSEQDIAQMMEWSNEGFTQRQIAELIGTVQSNVQRHLQKALVEPVEAVELGPFNSFEIDHVASLLDMRSKLKGYATQATDMLNQIATLDGQLATAITMLSDARLVDALHESNVALQAELSNVKIGLERAIEDYRQEKEARLNDSQLQAHQK